MLRGCLPEEGVVSSCEAADVVCCHSDRCNGQLLGGKGRLRKLLQEETSELRSHPKPHLLPAMPHPSPGYATPLSLYAAHP